jgi:hypothetical protein
LDASSAINVCFGSKADMRLEFKTSIGARRFPPPWSVEELDACFVVRDHNGYRKTVACRWQSC